MKYDASHAELMRLQKISGINEENLRLEITALTDRCLRLTNLQESESALRRRYEERANKYDVAEAELTKLRKEVRVVQWFDLDHVCSILFQCTLFFSFVLFHPIAM